MNRIGAEKVIYVHWPPFGTDPVRDPLTLCACGFPDDMLARYAASRLWERSRNVTRAIEAGVPFYAGRSLPETPGGGAEDWSDEMAQSAAEFDAILETHVPVSFAAFGPHGRTGYYAYWLPKHAPRLSQDEMTVLQSVGQMSHVRYCSLRETDGHTERYELTPREKRVLSLNAAGYSNKRAARRMRLPETTVRAVMRSAGRKMRVPKEDSRQTVLKAVALGEVSRVDAERSAVVIRSDNGRSIINLKDECVGAAPAAPTPRSSVLGAILACGGAFLASEFTNLHFLAS